MSKESESDSTFTVPATRNVKTRKRIFCQVWLDDPVFKPWLQKVQHDPYKGKCTICDVHITALKSNLERHAKSQEHINNTKYGKRSVPAAERRTDDAPSIDAATSVAVGADSSTDDIFSEPAVKKGWKQSFCEEWLQDPAFKPWLQQTEHDPYLGQCAFCGIYITAKKYNLHQHANSRKHIQNITYGKRLVPGEGGRCFVDEVKEAEIRVCVDAVEHNRPFNSFNYYVELTREVMKNPNVLQRMSLSARKMKAISFNVINKSIVGKIIEKVQDKFFSVLIDETTDVSNMKLLCFLIRYVDKEQICTDLLDLIKVKEATAENLYQCFRQSLDKYNLPITNMVGVCVDNTNVMVGAHNSLTSRLIAANAEICILPCICDSLHLAAHHACECLPEHVEKFLQSLYSYFSQSPKRLSMLEGTQQFMKVEKQKVKQPSPTRWLALAECIKRVLDQWTVLYSVLAEAASDNESVAKKLLSSMNSVTKAYLEFMDYFLHKFTTLNKFFQGSEVRVHCLLPECYNLLASLGINFINSENMNKPNIHKIDIYNEENLLPLTTIFTGIGCMDTLTELTNDNWEENGDMIQFYTNIRKCYQTGYKNIVDRVPFDDTFLKALDFLNPQTAADTANHGPGKIQCILNKFNSKFDRRVVLNEWQALPIQYLGKTKEEIKEMSLPQFWHRTSITFNACEYAYANISQLAQLCLTLPHSNADVERYFSTRKYISRCG